LKQNVSLSHGPRAGKERTVMAEKGSIESLRAAGVKVDQLSPEQREVLASLSDEEVRTLARLQERVTAAKLPQHQGGLIF
jgi:hypothetical protein